MINPNLNPISQTEEICTQSINIAPYMSKFVRQLHAEDNYPLQTPFILEQFGAVLMVDIVGFSKMTSIASSKGDVGAEMLSSQIGTYFDLAIRIIEYHGGDVVKFLGDALLVIFQADPTASTDPSTSQNEEDPSAVERRYRLTVRKAAECGQELLARLSNYRIYLSEREFSRKLTSAGGGCGPFSNNSNTFTTATTTTATAPTAEEIEDRTEAAMAATMAGIPKVMVKESSPNGGDASDDRNQDPLSLGPREPRQIRNEGGAATRAEVISWDIEPGADDDQSTLNCNVDPRTGSLMPSNPLSFNGISDNNDINNTNSNHLLDPGNVNNTPTTDLLLPPPASAASRPTSVRSVPVMRVPLEDGNNSITSLETPTETDSPRRSSMHAPDSPISNRLGRNKSFGFGAALGAHTGPSFCIPITGSGGVGATTGGGSFLSTPGGVMEFRKREASITSQHSGSRYGSPSGNKSKSGTFFSTAKNYIAHSIYNDRTGMGANASSVGGGGVGVGGVSGGGLNNSGSAGTSTGAGGSEADDDLEDSHDLQLHMALIAGEISNIIIGELGRENGLDDLLSQETGRLEYAICGEPMATIEDALNLAHAGEVAVTQSAWNYLNADLYPEIEPRGDCYILRNTQPPGGGATETPLMRRVRDEKLLNTPVGSNQHYYKYINKSAIHRLILYPDDTFPAQFRNATILFISLGDVKPWTPEGLATCQTAILAVHKVTTTYEGFIQQFAVDDKGATLLCAFGLPYPRSHEKEAVFAAKSAWMIREKFLECGLEGFRISLATGVIFTSTIGNEFRRDPAIVGDTIVISVRILKVDYALESVVCDDATKLACTLEYDGLCEFQDMGEELVKGKVHPLKIWRLVQFGAKKQTRRPEDAMVDETIGYEPERERVAQFVAGWAKVPMRNTILVTGPRGSGKSMFYQQICHIADNEGYQICAAASAEVEKNTEYYPIKFLFLGLFEIMRRQDVPYADQLAEIVQASKEAQMLQDAIGGVKTPVAEDAEDKVPDLHLTRPLNPAFLSNGSSDTSMSEVSTVNQPSTIGIAAPPSASTVSFQESVTWSPDGYPSQNPHRRRSSGEMSFSPSISRYGEQTRRRSTNMTQLQAFINVCLRKVGNNDPMLMPVLDEIISTISTDNATPALSVHDDGILADFVVMILNYASQFVKIIVMFEDIQWCDPKSQNIIQVIHERCPNILVVMFSRPQRDYGGSMFLRKITAHFKHLEIALEGLKRREIEQALLKAFEPHGVTSISPEVIELVQERTRGNPKFVKNMSNMLKDFCHVNIVEGELLTTGQEATQSPSSKTMEEMLMKQDRKKMTLMQYDRIRPKFQEFLKIASCLGTNFSLAEVDAIRPLDGILGAPEPGKSYASSIYDMDTYRFLSLATDQQANIQFSENPLLQTIYTFGSGSTAKDIYDSIPYEERVVYHLKLGSFYESLLESDADTDETSQKFLDCQDLLPQITRHYLKTDHTAKKIKYLRKLAAYNLKGNMLTDTTQNVNELINILNTERGAKDMVCEEDMADIYGMKGEALSKRMRIEEAEPALLDSLTRYGVFWPTYPRQWRMELLREKFRFFINYHRGTTPVRSSSTLESGCTGHFHRQKSKMDPEERLRLGRIIRVLACLQNIYFWRTQPSAAILSSLYTLSYCRRLGVPSGDQTASMGRLALLLYFQGKKRKSDQYMNDAIAMNDAGLTTEGMLPAMKAFVAYNEGRSEEAHRLLDDAIQECKSFGVVSNLATFYRAVTIKAAYRALEGALYTHPEDGQLLRTLSAVAIQNGDSEGEALFAIPTLGNLLVQDRVRDAESWVALVENYIMPRSKAMNLLMIHGVLSFYYARVQDFNKAWLYVEMMSEKVEEQGVGAHPFPMSSCTYTIVTLYALMDNNPSLDMLPNGQVNTDLVHAEADMRPDVAHKALDHIIAYLETDPLTRIAGALIALAQALKFFIDGHEVEGLERLRQGWRESSAKLEGIDFLGAYYLSKIGRHCTDLQAKKEQYQKVDRMVAKMGLEPLAYLMDPATHWIPSAAGAAGLDRVMANPLPPGAGEAGFGSMIPPLGVDEGGFDFTMASPPLGVYGDVMANPLPPPPVNM